MMNISPFHDEQATMQETLLRVTLHEHAPQEVDLEQSWAVVSRQMASLDGKPQPGMSLRLLTPGNSRRLPRRTSWPLVAVAALVLALLGAGLAGPLSSWFGGRTSTPFAYAAINESVQISNGITLTATKGYVDPKHLVLYYDVRVSSDLSGKYAVAFAFVEKSTIQDKTVESVCETQANNPVFHCAIVFPSDGDIAGETFTVTWHISEMRLMSRYLLLPTHPTTVISTRIKTPDPTPTFIQGDWTLRFSLPFRHEVQDPLLISFPGEVSFAIPKCPNIEIILHNKTERESTSIRPSFRLLFRATHHFPGYAGFSRAIYNRRTREQPVNLSNTIFRQFVQIEDTMMPVVINHFFQVDLSCV